MMRVQSRVIDLCVPGVHVRAQINCVCWCWQQKFSGWWWWISLWLIMMVTTFISSLMLSTDPNGCALCSDLKYWLFFPSATVSLFSVVFGILCESERLSSHNPDPACLPPRCSSELLCIQHTRLLELRWAFIFCSISEINHLSPFTPPHICTFYLSCSDARQ